MERYDQRAQLSRFGPDTVGEWVRRRVESGVGAVICLEASPCRSTRSNRCRSCPNKPSASDYAPPFPKAAPDLTLRDSSLGTIFEDGHFVDLYPQQGQPACPPWRLALITLMQFREGLERSAGG